jgi:hypothetical protein
MPTYNNLSGQDIKFQASQVANEIERFMWRWEEWAAQLLTIPADDLTALGVDAGQQTQMGSMRTDVAAMVADYKANRAVFVRRHAQLLP